MPSRYPCIFPECFADTSPVFSATWATSLPASDGRGASWTLRLPYATSAPTAAWVAAAATTTTTTTEFQPEPLPISGHPGGTRRWHTLCIWRPSGQR